MLKQLMPFMNLSEGSDMTELPEGSMQEIQKNIRKGAKESEQEWANALQLVHSAYEEAGVERPTPDMKAGWKQYEINIMFAVEQLAKFRGMKGNWRMSASIFNEAIETESEFIITEISNEHSKTYSVRAKSRESIINDLEKNLPQFKLRISESSPNETSISFYKWGIKQNYRIRIHPKKTI